MDKDATSSLIDMHIEICLNKSVLTEKFPICFLRLFQMKNVNLLFVLDGTLSFLVNNP